MKTISLVIKLFGNLCDVRIHTLLMLSLEYSKYGLPDSSTKSMQRLRSYTIPVIKLPIVMPDIVANRHNNFLFILPRQAKTPPHDQSFYQFLSSLYHSQFEEKNNNIYTNCASCILLLNEMRLRSNTCHVRQMNHLNDNHWIFETVIR